MEVGVHVLLATCHLLRGSLLVFKIDLEEEVWMRGELDAVALTLRLQLHTISLFSLCSLSMRVALISLLSHFFEHELLREVVAL